MYRNDDMGANCPAEGWAGRDKPSMRLPQLADYDVEVAIGLNEDARGHFLTCLSSS